MSLEPESQAPEQAEGESFLRRCTQVKNIWVPYGE